MLNTRCSLQWRNLWRHWCVKKLRKSTPRSNVQQASKRQSVSSCEVQCSSALRSDGFLCNDGLCLRARPHIQRGADCDAAYVPRHLLRRSICTAALTTAQGRTATQARTLAEAIAAYLLPPDASSRTYPPWKRSRRHGNCPHKCFRSTRSCFQRA
jgi:hypothetical protein